MLSLSTTRSNLLQSPSGLVFLAGLLLKTTLLLVFPALYGGDTVFHLRNHQQLLLGHQLLMLQMMIYGSYKISTAPMLFRMVMVLIGSLAGVGFYSLCRQLTNQTVALWAAFFFVTNPFLNEVSIVPFQEILMLGAVCFALAFYFGDRFLAAALMLAVACLTRQEAWLICPVLIFDYSRRNRWKARQIASACCLFAAVPVIWAALHLGLSSPGSYTLEVPHTAARLVRWVYLGWVCVKQTPVPVTLLMLVGVAAACWEKRGKERGTTLIAGFIGLYLLAIVCAAHGIGHPGMPNTELFISAREATMLVGTTLLVSAFGLETLLRQERWRRISLVTAAVAIVLGVVQSGLLIASQTGQPDVRVSYETAKYLDRHATEKDKVLFVAKPFSPDDWNDYLQKAAQLQGDKGLKSAQRVLQSIDLSPLDYQRTAVQTNLPERNLVATADPAGVSWLVLWNNVAVPKLVRDELHYFREMKILQVGPLTVTIWKRS